MARLRTLKPGFFTNEQLAEIPPLGRLLFAGLWCVADREGRLFDRPRRIKAEILPYDECDINALLTALVTYGLIARYRAGGADCIEILTFLKHQNPHYKEPPSNIPPYVEREPLDDSAINGQSSAVDSAINPETSRAGMVLGLGSGLGSGLAPSVRDRVNGFVSASKEPPKEAYLDDFEAFFAEYPKQLGKAPACGAYRQALRRGIKAAELLSAVKNYRQFIENEGQDDQFVPDAKKWLGEDLWRDYRAGVPKLTLRSSGTARASPINAVKAAYEIAKAKQREGAT